MSKVWQIMKHFAWNFLSSTNLQIVRSVHFSYVPLIGSADAERCFSIMNVVIGQRRHKLGGESVEDEVRIKMNGPLPGI